jgi:hypothetical protein
LRDGEGEDLPVKQRARALIAECPEALRIRASL